MSNTAYHRQHERRSRARRAARLELWRSTAKALEYTLSLVPTLSDDGDDTLWEIMLEPDVARLRRHLLRSMRLAQEVRWLQIEQVQLHRLLREHRLASYAIAGLLAARDSDNLNECLSRWRAITLKNYVPLSLDDCEAEIAAAQKELNAFLWSDDVQVVDRNYFGWRVRQRVTRARDAVQFSFQKIMRGFRVEDYVDLVWNGYTDEASFEKVILGKNQPCWLHVLQKITPDMFVIRCGARYAGISTDTHMIYLVSRSKTETGYTHFVRPLIIPEVQLKISQPTDMWITHYVWYQFDALNEDASNYRVQIGGKITGQDSNYIVHWLMEKLFVLMRIEKAATGRGLLASE